MLSRQGLQLAPCSKTHTSSNGLCRVNDNEVCPDAHSKFHLDAKQILIVTNTHTIISSKEITLSVD